MGLVYVALGFFMVFQHPASAVTLTELRTRLGEQGADIHFPKTIRSEKELDTFQTNLFRDLKALREQVTQTPIDQTNFETVGWPLDELWELCSRASGELTLSAALSTREPYAQRFHETIGAIEAFQSECLHDPEIRARIKKLAADGALSKPQKAYVKAALSEFAAVPDLDPEQQEIADALQAEISELSAEFNSQIASASQLISLTPAELEGVPSTILESLPKDGPDHVLVDAAVFWQWETVVTHAKNKTTRDRVERGWWARGDLASLKKLHRISALRQKLASVLGAKSWAAHRLSQTIGAKDAVESSLERLLSDADAGFAEEKKQIRSLLGMDTVLARSDAFFAQRQIEQAHSHESGLSALEDYFPLSHVLSETLRQMGDVLSVRIEELEGLEAVERWHADERVFIVSDKKSGDVLGILGLDLLQRDGKDNWFFSNDVTSSRVRKNGIKQRPFVSVFCAFKPSAHGDEPLLNLEEVRTLWHELGHGLHSALNQVPFAMQRVGMEDAALIEVPSTFFEQLAMRRLVSLSRHRKSGKAITPELAARLSRETFPMHTLKSRALRSLIDLQIHGEKPLDLVGSFAPGSDPQSGMRTLELDLFRRFFYPLFPKSSFLASFDYVTAGYDASYWGYLWAAGIAHALNQDLAKRQSEAEIVAWGERFRQSFLERGLETEGRDRIQGALDDKLDTCRSILEYFSQTESD